MATTIVTKNGSGAPTASDLVAGELAVDLTNGRLYTTDLDSGGTVIEIGLNPSGNVDVTGTVTADGLTVDGDGSFVTSDGAILKLENSTTAMTSNDVIGELQFYANDGSTNGTGAKVNIIAKTTSAAGSIADLTFGTSGSTSATALPRLNIAGNGNISFYEDTGTTAKFFWDASAESLGIGTTSPTNPITIVGTGGASLTASKGAVVDYQSSSVTDIVPIGFSWSSSTSNQNPYWGMAFIPTNYSSAIGELGFYTGNTERMRIDSNGNVGIGTSSPSSLLHLSSSAPTLQFSETDVGVQNYIQASGGGFNFFADDTNAASGTKMGFFIDGSERMRIDSSGNVGIGRTPDANGVLQLNVAAGLNTNLTFAENSVNKWMIGSLTSSNALRFYDLANSREAMRIDASGNVGIGTSSPNQKLHISDSAPFARLESTSTSYNGFTTKNDSGNFYFGIDDSGGTFYGSAYARAIYADGAYPVTFYTNATERMRIDSSGNVGIGVTPATDWNTGYDALQIGHGSAIMSASGSEELFLNMNSKWASDSSWEYISTGTAASIKMDQTTPFTFRYAASGSADADLTWSEAMRIDSSGNLLVGTTSSAGKFTLVSNQYNAMSVQVNADGNVGASWKNGAGSEVGYIQVNTSSTLYSTSSDQRLKDNIVDAPSASDDIDAIQVRSFDWKVDGSHQKYGMVAQELVTVAPSAVSQPEDPEEMMGVDYSKLVPMMLKEIQSLRARVAQLES